MAFEKDGFKYPSSFSEMMEDGQYMLKTFQNWISSDGESLRMLHFFEKRPVGVEVYTKYLARDASYRVRVPARVSNAASEVLRGPSDQLQIERTWQPVIMEVAAFFNFALDRKLKAYYRSPDFMQLHHTGIMLEITRLYGKPASVTRRLRIQSSSGAALVQEVMEALRTNDQLTAQRIAAKLIKDNKLPVSVGVFLDAVKNKGKLPTSDTAKKISVNSTKLLFVGFQNYDKSQVKKLAKLMATTYAKGDIISSKDHYRAICRLEPDNSRIPSVGYEKVIKLFYQKGVLKE